MNEKEESKALVYVRATQIVWVVVGLSMLFLIYRVFSELI